MAKNETGVWRFAGYTISGVIGLAGIIFAWHQIDQFLISGPRFVLASTEDAEDSSLHLEGVRYASRDKIHDLFRRDASRSVYLLPLAERRRQLLAIEWVRDASVSRIWPDQITVRVTERKPVAFVRAIANEGAPVLIDEDGVLLPLHDSAKFRLPVVTGIRRQQTEEERRSRIRRMLRLQDEIGNHIDRISEIDLADVENIKVTYPLSDRAMILYLGHSRYALRLKRFLENIDEIRRRLPNARVLDLRLEDRITSVKDSEGGPGAE